MSRKNEFFGAMAILVGTAVGAGIFGIPYVISKVGFMVGLLYLIGLGLVIIVTTLCYGEVVTRTKERLQMSGYALKYLGKWGKRIITASLAFGIYGALIAYTIEVGNFLFAILGPSLGGSSVIYSLIFFAIASLAILFGLGLVVNIEKIMVVLLIVVMSIIFIFGFSRVNIANLTYADLSPSVIFLPYGVILFAFAAATAVPNMRDLLINKKRSLKKAISIGLLIPLVIYALFALIVMGISGKNTSEAAITGLQSYLGQWIIVAGAFFGILSMTTSFLALGLVLRELYHYDYKIKKLLAWLIVVIPVLIIFLLQLTTFIGILGAVGAIMGGCDGIIILLMHQKAKKLGKQKPWYTINLPTFVRYILIAIFGLGIIYEAIVIFK